MTLKHNILFASLFTLLSVHAWAQDDRINPPTGDGSDYKAFNTQFSESPDDKFSSFLPTYFIIGKKDVKLQFSMKYRILKDTPLYFAYSQRMFWQVNKSSAPFRDIDYSPELFYRLKVGTAFVKTIDMGYHHTSNGKDGDASRSMDQLAATFNMLKAGSDNRTYISLLELHYTYNRDGGNQDIDDYIGYFKVTFAALNLFNVVGKNRFDLGVMAFPGRYAVSKGAIEFDLRYHPPWVNFNPDILLQYYRGYVEDLIDYNHDHSRLRIGLILYI